MSSKKKVDPALVARVRGLMRELGSFGATARYLGVRKDFVECVYHGFATPLATNAVAAAVGCK